MSAPKVSDFTGRGIRGARAWDSHGRGGGGCILCPGGCRHVSRECRRCQLGMLSDMKLPVSKGGVKKSELPEEGENEKLSIALGLSQRGGGLREASPAGVLGERGAAFAHLLLLLRSACCWETGLLLVYLGCRVPQGSRSPPFHKHPASHRSQPQHPLVLGPVLAAAALLLFNSPMQENLCIFCVVFYKVTC